MNSVNTLPRITIVIPTRERSDTLKATLQTCLDQAYEKLEIIVSDNASLDDTHSVVTAVNDERVRYINPGRRLSMSHNWEFALQHVEDGYVSFLGDDDGLLPNSISKLAQTLVEYDLPDAYFTTPPLYVWSTVPESSQHLGIKRNQLCFAFPKGPIWKSSEATLKSFSRSECPYGYLPGLYYGAVKTDTLEKAKRTGKLFRSMYPDIYSAVAIASVTNRFLFGGAPFAICGISHRSTGVASLCVSKDNQVDVSAGLFENEPNIPFHDDFVSCPSIAVIQGECYRQAQDVGLISKEVSWNFTKMITAAVNEAHTAPAEKREEIFRALEEMCNRHHLSIELLSATCRIDATAPTRKALSFDSATRRFSGNAADLGIKDISEAASFFSNLLRISPDINELFDEMERRGGASDCPAAGGRRELIGRVMRRLKRKLARLTRPLSMFFYSKVKRVA